MTPITDLPLAPAPETVAPPKPAEFELAFQQKGTLIAGYLAAFAVVYYRQPAERSTAQLQATLRIENAVAAFPPATTLLNLSNTLIAEVAAEAASQLIMGLAGVAEQLGAAITRCRISFPALEAQNPNHEWCVTLDFATDHTVAVSFACTGGCPGPGERPTCQPTCSVYSSKLGKTQWPRWDTCFFWRRKKWACSVNF